MWHGQFRGTGHVAIAPAGLSLSVCVCVLLECRCYGNGAAAAHGALLWCGRLHLSGSQQPGHQGRHNKADVDSGANKQLM